ncbi:NAD(P)/FAD-dependent oxidoreductase [Sphingomonas sp.]|jgi:cyclohexanone monooxygenase|uniref:flavin-containing monooxygenase n=1 Tax=Sphingomonas sp. TaxID=28214 RepID=UPI002E15D9B9|nr:NAD(P)/FAD-dependent oxidoreductase [Sphingomonas sp.]
MTTLLDKADLRAKYAAERAKRLRPEGNAQYQRLAGKFASLAADPYTPYVERDPVADHVTFAFVGAGMSGLVVGARLKEAGIGDFRLIDKAGGVGGTWYWNRYPGARCDTAAMIYLPLLEETGYMPTEKYVRGPEILAHCERIARHFGLYDKALFHTEVSSIEWQEAARVWRITTNRGDDFTAKYVAIGTGPLHVAKLPGIPGIEQFKGKSFHTSRWDYGYTGGDADGAPMAKLADKRVAVIGTGATSVQCIPHLAKTAKQLFVFQRTPSSVDVRNNHPIDPQWYAQIAKPGWQKRWMDNFVENMGGGIPSEDLIDDGWTAISRRIREKALGGTPLWLARIVTRLRKAFNASPDQRTTGRVRAAFEDADIEKMEQIRARVDAVVQDPQTAAQLKPWYAQLCKRPCFSDEYLPAYNAPNTVLVDTDGKGVEQITETGLVVNGTLYEVDCIVYASGFEYGANFQLKTGFDLKGRGGQMLSDYWSDGLQTLHGLHMHGFPNAFAVQMNQAANMVSNIPHNIVDHAATIAQVVAYAERRGYAEVEPTQEAVSQWVSLIMTTEPSVITSTDCTPGFWNNEGQGWNETFRRAQGHPGGAGGFFTHIDAWRRSGRYAGLMFNR